MSLIIRMLIIMLVLSGFDAQAIPLPWTLNGVTFADGATASGSLVYDADTNAYASVNITVSGGTNPSLNGTYSFSCLTPCNGLTSSAAGVMLLTASPSGNLTGLPALAISFAAPLGNSGGSVTLAGSNATCNNSTCSIPTAPARVITAGTANAGTPLPSLTWTLHGVTLSDGATASGSFVYTPSANLFSSISVTVSGGTNPSLNGTYSFICTAPCSGVAPSAAGLLLLTSSSSGNLTGLPALSISFSPSLGGSGGTVLLTGNNATCANATCSFGIAPARTIVSGNAFVPATAVPTLSNQTLLVLSFLIALAATFGRLQRRQT